MLKKKISKPEQPVQPDPATAPVIDLVIRYDGRTGRVELTVIGGTVEFSAAYRLLDAARATVQQQEREALVQQMQNEQQRAPTMKDVEEAINRQTPITVQLPAESD